MSKNRAAIPLEKFVSEAKAAAMRKPKKVPCARCGRAYYPRGAVIHCTRCIPYLKGEHFGLYPMLKIRLSKAASDE